ncbi:MAG: tetratricopeptide repeat protein [Steroidobacteraceae bacterium]
MKRRQGNRTSGNSLSSAAAAGRGASEEFNRANLLHQGGDINAAAAAYRKILLRDPGHFAANHLLGIIELQGGRAENAVNLIGRAIDADARDAHAHLNLGAAFMALGRADDALRSFDRALEINAKWALAWTNRGNALLRLKRPDAALGSYHSALECDPRDPRAHCNLGNALRELGRFEDALNSYQQALAFKPDYALALRNCASLLNERQRPAEALACYERAARIDPNDKEALLACGNALLSLSRPLEAVAYFDRALVAEPHSLEALNNRGIAHMELGDAAAALGSFDGGLAISPRTPGFWSNRGEALRRLNRFGDAAESYSMLLDIAPDFELAPGKLLNAKLLACEWSSYDGMAAEIESRVADGKRVCAPFEFLAVSGSAALQFKCAQIYAANLCAALGRPPERRAPNHGGKIRLAYVSADFGNRPVTHLLAGVLERHDRDRFETIGISLRPEDPTDVGQRVMRSFDRFIDVSRESDRAVVELMSALDVHIAIDLMGYTHGSRSAIFFFRAAPIQVTYLGFPGTSGSAFIDYIIADDFVIPEHSRPNYSEQVVYLPECFQANDQRKPVGAAPLRRQVGLPEAAFVFCCFNNSYKFNPTMFEIWCRLLLARPESVLWLVADAPEVETHLRREAGRRGVDGHRIIFAERRPYEEHLERQVLADLFLDTLPFNAGSTASDALRVGLPILTCAGEAFASRMAGSLLRSVGLPELVAHSLGEYERRALELSGGGSELRDLRSRLASASMTRPLFDAQRFCRHLEAGYRQMWEQHLLGLEPAALTVDRIPG